MSEIVELTQGRVALVASADWSRVGKLKWRYRAGFPVTTVAGKEVCLGRYILGATGSAKVYYKDGDRCNCVRENLSRVRNNLMRKNKEI